jgi:hypothetical protein
LLAWVCNSVQTLSGEMRMIPGRLKRAEYPVMLDYRIYKLDAKGHVTGPALVLFCEQDEDVIRKVEYLIDGHDVEILQGFRVVTRLQSGVAYPTRSDLQCRAYSTATE